MNQQDNKKLFALVRNSLTDLTPKQRNELAQMCIDMNKTTSIECYTEALNIPKRTVQNRISLNKITFIKIHNKKFPSLGIID